MPVPAAARCGRVGKHRAGERRVVEIAPAAAGDADIDGGRGRDRGGHVGVVRGERITIAGLASSPATSPARSNEPQSGCRTAPRRHDPACGSANSTLRRRGTPPGARPNRRQVSWLAGRCPSPPSRVFPVALWHRARRLQLRGQLRHWNVVVPHRIPCSLSCERPSTPTLSGVTGRFVNVIVGRRRAGAGGPGDFSTGHRFSEEQPHAK